MMHNSFSIALMNFIHIVVSLLMLISLILGMSTTVLYWPTFEVPAIFWASFIVFVIMFWGCKRFFDILDKKIRSVLKKINNKENLALSGDHLLGYPSTKFVAFDQENRKLAFCHISGAYKIYDFSYILKWDFTWDRITEAKESGSVYKGREKRKNYKLHLYVADVDNPVRKYAMESEQEARKWEGRLNALFNG